MRHGQYVQDTESSEFGSLTRLGRRQASKTGQMLAEEKILALYSSDMPRAVESCEIISRRLGSNGKQQRSRLLREGMPALDDWALEWVAKQDRISRREARHRSRLDNKRMTRAFEKYFVPIRRGNVDETELYVAHGNIIRFLITKALGIAATKWRVMDLRNCSISRFEVKPDGEVKLVSLNETGHLSIRQLTY